MKEQIKTPGKELSDKKIGNLSDAEFKTLVIRMLTKMIEYRLSTEEEVKAIPSEIKKNIQGTRAPINDLERKEEINIQPEQKNEETRIQKKMRRGLGTPGTTLNIPTSKS